MRYPTICKPTARYRVLVSAFSPVFLGYTLWRTALDGGTNYLKERLGFYSVRQQATENRPVLWIHAASVGEVFTVLPLLRSLKEPLLVTTMSPTGAAVLKQQNLPHIQHSYLPLDLRSACQRFFRHQKIREGWIVETEIWPWLYASAKANDVPLTIINGRLSKRTSAQAQGLLASTYKRALSSVTVLARSEQDALGFASLGANTHNIHVVGNLKYANPSHHPSQTPPQRLLPQAYVLAASTHDDEELQIARAWCQQTSHPNVKELLVIVPRHPERGESIVKTLQAADIESVARSKNDQLQADTRVYIADTLGELGAWYAHATACFVGGSLINRGGHNMLEPARAGCPVIVGPHTFNFHDIVQALEDAQAINVASDKEQVVKFFLDVISDTEIYRAMTQRASIQAKNLEDVLNDYLLLLQPDTTDITGYDRSS